MPHTHISHFQIFTYEISTHSLLRPFKWSSSQIIGLSPLTRIMWTPQLLFNPWRKSRHYTQRERNSIRIEKI